ncbi:MAG: FKBP-type peptidyl-prolyl cis-trans isomerase [Cyclobacteriaceae bacterium]|nr:FKBP-type peptidyl-prolyl cis-trans isomerase [Cyclobacteriaceae bacterium]
MKLVKSMYVVLWAGLFLWILSCDKKSPVPHTQGADFNQRVDSFFIQAAIPPYKQDSVSQIYVNPIVQNTGADAVAPAIGDVIYVRYSLAVLNGTSMDTIVFSSQVPQSIPAGYGIHAIYPVGIDKGIEVSGMKSGDTYAFILPPDMGYGSFVLDPVIPENAILQVILTLDSVKNVQALRDQEILLINRKIIDWELNDTIKWPGTLVSRINVLNSTLAYKVLGDALPTGAQVADSSRVNVSFTTQYLDSTLQSSFELKYASQPLEFVWGTDPVLIGFQTGLQQMHVGEQALFIAPFDLTYHESVQIFPHVSGFRNTYFDALYDHLRANKIIPAYGFEIEPFRSLLFKAKLNSIE